MTAQVPELTAKPVICWMLPAWEVEITVVLVTVAAAAACTSHDGGAAAGLPGSRLIGIAAALAVVGCKGMRSAELMRNLVGHGAGEYRALRAGGGISAGTEADARCITAFAGAVTGAVQSCQSSVPSIIEHHTQIEIAGTDCAHQRAMVGIKDIDIRKIYSRGRDHWQDLYEITFVLLTSTNLMVASRS